jgi:chromosome segregation ATPase
VTSNMSTQAPNSSFNDMTDSVSRLHTQLKETQESMQRIYERANLLKKRVSEKKEQEQKQPAKTDREEELQTENQRLSYQVAQLQEQIKSLESTNKEEHLYKQRLQLVEQNRVLRETLAQHEAAVVLIVQRCREQLIQERRQGQERLLKLQDMLQNERGENIRLLSENAQLKSLLQLCVDDLRDVASQRDAEMMEIDVTVLALSHENENLRLMMSINNEEQIEPPPLAVSMSDQFFNPKHETNVEPIVPVDDGKID